MATGRPKHRPRKVTPEQISDAVDEMIRQYEETGDIGALTDYRLLSLLGITSRGLEDYYQGVPDRALLEDIANNNNENSIQGEEYKILTYRDALKRLIEYRRGECVRHIAGGGASTTITGWIFLSKQPHWGGFQDVQRQEVKGSQSITVNIAGPDGKNI